MPPMQLTQWQDLLEENLPCLSRPQQAVLALYSFAVASIGSCGLTSVATFLGLTLGLRYSSLRQRLREFYKPSAAKAGTSRRELDVSCCFAPMLRWSLRLLRSSQLALAIDATTLGDRFSVLSISLLYRATAIPLAWCVLPGNTKGAWKPQWLRLFELLKHALPDETFVIVLADRGLYAKWLFEAICACGWHPMLRVNDQAGFRRSDGQHYAHFSQVIAASDQAVSLTGVAFSKHPLACTLLAYRSSAHSDPWLVLSDLPEAQVAVQWYALRSWIEQGFKAIKRGALQWQRTRMSDPQRVERLWLVLSVATLLLLALATRQEDHQIIEDADPIETEIAKQPTSVRGSKPLRQLRLQRLGHLALIAMLCSQTPLGCLRLHDEPWRNHHAGDALSTVNVLLCPHPP